jgi:hypothetical protein
MVRTYWFFPVFNEASGNLDLQPFARNDHIDTCRPRAMSTHRVARCDGAVLQHREMLVCS